MKTSIHDPDLGSIELRRFRSAKSIRLKLRPDGTVYVSMPPLTPLFVVKRLIASHKPKLLEARQDHVDQTQPIYREAQQIGASHRIVLNHQSDTPQAYAVGQIIRWSLPPGIDPDSQPAQAILRPVIRRVLDRQAKAYLPRRLKHLASQHGFVYNKTRFGNAKGRWGSCSSSGTISLNVALMKLPSELIDYVLIHELCHTEQMNHSPAFWQLVENCLPEYRRLRKNLKQHSPYL